MRTEGVAGHLLRSALLGVAIAAFAPRAVGQDTAAPLWFLTAQYPDERGKLVEHGAALADLEHRWHDRGLRVQIDLPLAAALRLLERAPAPGGVSRKPPWPVHSQLPPVAQPQLALASGGGPAVWTGPDPDGFEDVIARVLTEADHGAAWLAQNERLPAYVTRYITDGPAITEAAERYCAALPHCGFAHASCFVDALWHRADLDGARQVAAQALAALATTPWSLAVFADLALRADPHDRELAAQTAKAIDAAIAALPDAALPRLVRLRAQLRADPELVTVERAGAIWTMVERSPETLLDFATTLAAAPEPVVFGPLAHRALEVAAGRVEDLELLAAARYAVALRCDRDAAAAESILGDFVAGKGVKYDLNDAAWWLVTGFQTMGRYDAFALGLTERMQRGADKLASGRLDTVALVQFVNGRFADAIANEQHAIAGDDDDPRFALREQRYRRTQERLGGGSVRK